ncbi:MAG: hypothetical protein ACE5H8_05970 [Alphaproteobacteria bacterium]
MRKTRAAPFICWLWAAPFALLLWVGYEAAPKYVEPPPSAAFDDFNRARIAAFARTPRDGVLRVVALGNSRLKHATLDDGDLARLADEVGAGRMAFLRLVNNWAVFEDFEPFADDLLALKPDVIVLQLELLGAEHGRVGRQVFLVDYLFWRLLGFGPWNPRQVDQRDLQFAKPCADDRDALRLRGRVRMTEAWIVDDGAGTSTKLARAFVARARAAGIRVVLLAVPKTERMEAVRPSARDGLVAAANNLERADDGLRLLRYPGAFADDRYCDFLHMNDRGRAEYSAWLVRELARD